MNEINRLLLLAVVVLQVLTANCAHAETDPAEAIRTKEIGFVTQLGTKLDLNLPFNDENGLPTTLGQLIQPAKPTIFIPMYYSCPRLCGLLMNGMVELIKALDLKQGAEYNVVTLSFDPTEKPELAKQKQRAGIEAVHRSDVTAATWRFLTGSQENIRALLSQAGFRYKFEGGEYLHSSGFFVLTPSGVISQYFTGIEFSAWDVRLALVEASQGGIGSAVDHILLYCYDFDPIKGKYTLTAYNLLRGGSLFAVILFALVAVRLSKRVVRKN